MAALNVMNMKSEVRQKTEKVMVRVTPEQLRTLRDKAHDAGVTVPEYLRRLGLGRKLHTRVEAGVINELRRLGGLQKHLFTGGAGVLSKEYANILIEIREAIKRIGV